MQPNQNFAPQIPQNNFVQQQPQQQQNIVQPQFQAQFVPQQQFIQPQMQYVQPQYQGFNQPQQQQYIQPQFMQQQPQQFIQPQMQYQYVQPQMQYVQPQQQFIQPQQQYVQPQQQFVQQQPQQQQFYVQPQIQQVQQVQQQQQPPPPSYQQHVVKQQPQQQQQQQIIPNDYIVNNNNNNNNNNINQQQQINQQEDNKENQNIINENFVDDFALLNIKNQPKQGTWPQPFADAKGVKIGPNKYTNKDAQLDAQGLREAMKGMGCDKDKVTSITGDHSHEQRLLIREEFIKVDQILYAKGPNVIRDLIQDLKSELGGTLQDLVISSYYTQGELDAYLLKKAMDGVGFNSELLIEVLCTRTNEQIENIKQGWLKLQADKKKQISLEDRIRDETKKLLSGNHFQHFCLTLLQCKRDANGPINLQSAQTDAEELNNTLIQDKKNAKDKFIEIFTSRSWSQIGQIVSCFQDVSKKFTLDAAIIKVMGENSDTSQGLRVIVQFCTQPYDFWAKRLKNCMKGMGTDEDTLIRIIVTRSEIDMENIKSIFGQRYGNGKTLKNWIEGDTSGNIRKLLLKLCGY